MPRDTSPYIVGDYWLDKRRDGKAPDIWQIAGREQGRLVYRSTKCRDVEKAKAALRSFDANLRSTGRQANEDAELLPHLFLYLKEHGPDVHRLDTVKSSFRAWIGFFMQDHLTTGVKVADVSKSMVSRFRRWRMEPHEWAVPWNGKVYRHSSKGVSGEAVQRNIDDLRAALRHAEDEKRIASAPKVPSVEKTLRSKPRRLVLTTSQLGAIVAYADHDPAVQAWLWLLIGTGVRPDAGLAFDPSLQWYGAVADMHPPGWPETNKRNPVVPVIDPLQKLLANWPGTSPVSSRKTWWRTMRQKLGHPPKLIPKTIRHTVATHLRSSGVPGEQISALLGHKDETDTLETTTQVYAHADPRKMKAALRALNKLWEQVEREADKWRRVHIVSITADRNKTVEPRATRNPRRSQV